MKIQQKRSMLLNELLKIGELDTKKFITLIISIQFFVWITICLDTMDIRIPLFRQIFCFFYLIFVPGILILRILKLHKLSIIEYIGFSIGLSIIVTMLTGLFINFLYPLLGIVKPISLIPLIITLSLDTVILCTLCHLKDNKAIKMNHKGLKDSISYPALYLILIPVMSIAGAIAATYYQNNIFYIFLLPIIALVAALVGFNKIIPERLNSFAVFAVGLALLYHQSLFSRYIVGADIYHEYYFANRVLLDGWWNPSTEGTINSMLSIVMLAPIFSEVCNLNLTWVLKIYYPFVFSIVPVILFGVYKKQIDNRLAFLSVFYFMSVEPFFSVIHLISLARQQIGELFFSLIILVYMSDLDSKNKRILMLIFGFGLITSHYALAFIFVFFLISLIIINKFKLKGDLKQERITLRFSLFYIILALAWYTYTSGGSLIDIVVNKIFYNIFVNFSDDLFTSHALKIATGSSPSVYGQILRIFYLSSQFLIIIGLSKTLISKKYFDHTYLIFSLLSAIILFISILTPFVGLDINRLFHISIIYLSPFYVIGLIFILERCSKLVAKYVRFDVNNISTKIYSIFLVIFLLFSSGWIFEIMGDQTRSIPLSQERIIARSIPFELNGLHALSCTEEDVTSIGWISRLRDKNISIYADLSRKSLFLEAYGMINNSILLTNKTKNIDNSYVYFGYPNIKYNLMNGPIRTSSYWNTTDIFPLIKIKNKIYSNIGSEIYL